jgi:hypothetical protein
VWRRRDHSDAARFCYAGRKCECVRDSFPLHPGDGDGDRDRYTGRSHGHTQRSARHQYAYRGCSDRHSDGRSSNGDAQRRAFRQADNDAQPRPYRRPDRNAGAKPDTGSHGDAGSNGDAHSEGHGDADFGTDSYPDRNGDTDGTSRGHRLGDRWIHDHAR